MDWTGIQFVTTGLSLVAFITAAALFAYQRQLASREKLLETVPPEARGEALRNAAEYIGVDLNQVAEKDRTRIVLEQLRIKEARQWQLTLVALVVAILLAAVAMAAILRGSPPVGSLGSSSLESVTTGRSSIASVPVTAPLSPISAKTYVGAWPYVTLLGGEGCHGDKKVPLIVTSPDGSLLATNECGVKTPLRLEDDGSVIAIEWNGVRGVLSPDRSKITWGDGSSSWSR